jgi:hypothetical protein
MRGKKFSIGLRALAIFAVNPVGDEHPGGYQLEREGAA